MERGWEEKGEKEGEGGGEGTRKARRKMCRLEKAVEHVLSNVGYRRTTRCRYQVSCVALKTCYR